MGTGKKKNKPLIKTVDQTLDTIWQTMQDPKTCHRLFDDVWKEPSIQNAFKDLVSQFKVAIDNNHEFLQGIYVSFVEWLKRYAKAYRVAGEGRGELNKKELRAWLLTHSKNDLTSADIDLVSKFLEYCSYLPDNVLRKTSFQEIFYGIEYNPSRFMEFRKTAKKADIAEPVIAGRKAGGTASRRQYTTETHPKWQAAALKIWGKNPSLSKKAVAEKISRGYSGAHSANTIRQVIKKPGH